MDVVFVLEVFVGLLRWYHLVAGVLIVLIALGNAKGAKPIAWLVMSAIPFSIFAYYLHFLYNEVIQDYIQMHPTSGAIVSILNEITQYYMYTLEALIFFHIPQILPFAGLACIVAAFWSALMSVQEKEAQKIKEMEARQRENELRIEKEVREKEEKARREARQKEEQQMREKQEAAEKRKKQEMYEIYEQLKILASAGSTPAQRELLATRKGLELLISSRRDTINLLHDYIFDLQKSIDEKESTGGNLYGYYGSRAKPRLNKWQAEISQLSKENQELREQLDYLQVDTSNFEVKEADINLTKLSQYNQKLEKRAKELQSEMSKIEQETMEYFEKLQNELRNIGR